MASAYLSLATSDHIWFSSHTSNDAELYTTSLNARVLIGGGRNQDAPPALAVGAADVDVQGTASAALVKSYGITVGLPPGVTESNDLYDLINGANHPGSNPFAWASNAVTNMQETASGAFDMAVYASNAMHGFSNVTGITESVAWASNQVIDLLDAAVDASNAVEKAEHASNTSIVALRRADLASNAGYSALSMLEGFSNATESAEFSSNLAVDASIVASAASNLAFGYLPSAADAALWASNALIGLEDAIYASNLSSSLVPSVQLASDKATSAYFTATTTIGKASWASNSASLASKDALEALNALNALSAAGLSGTGLSGDAFVYASNAAFQAKGDANAALVRVADMSNVVYPNQSRALYGSNMARAGLVVAQAASNAAHAALAVGTAAGSVADSALALATDGISASLGGAVGGSLDFSTTPAGGGILGVDRIGVGTTEPLYPVHVDRMATDENVSIWVSGSIQQLSDVREKMNVERIGGALEKLQAIRGYTYNYRNFGKRNAGVLAHEVEQVLPEAVHAHVVTSNLSVSYNSLIPLMIEAIHDLYELVKSRA